MVIEQDITQKKAEVEVLQAKMVALQKNMNADPDAKNREQLNKYLEENTQLDMHWPKHLFRLLIRRKWPVCWNSY